MDPHNVVDIKNLNTERTLQVLSRNAWHTKLAAIFSSPPVRIAVTLLCLWLISQSIDFRRVLEVATSANKGLICLGWLTTIAVIACAVAEWGILVRGFKAVPWSQLAFIYLKTLAPGQLLPAGMAGEAVKIYQVSERIGVANAVAAAAVARISSSVALGLWALWGAFNVHGTLTPLAVAICAIYLITMLAFWSLAFWPDAMAGRFVRRLKLADNQLFARVVPFAEALQNLGRSRALLLLSVGSALVGWGINFFALQLFALSTGAHIGLHIFALVLPLSLFATIAPFALNGLGLREGILIAVLVQAGVSSSQAAVITLLVDLQLIPFVLASALIWAWSRGSRGREHPDQGQSRVTEDGGGCD